LSSAKSVPENGGDPATKIVEGRQDIVEAVTDELVQRKSREPQDPRPSAIGYTGAVTRQGHIPSA
jgi:hypothetical protein